MRKKSRSSAFDSADKYDEEYLKAVYHSVELHEGRQKLERTVHDFLSFENRGAFKLTNAHSKRVWLRQLLPSFIEYNEAGVGWRKALDQGAVAVALVTFTHEGWACGDGEVDFDLDKAKQKVRNALSKLHYVACFEAAYYVDEEWRGKGNLISFHCHAVVWAEHKSQLQRMKMKAKARFKTILGNKSGIHLKALTSVKAIRKALCYQAKMPHRGYRTLERPDGQVRQNWAKLSRQQNYRLFLALQKYDLLDVWFAGGDGTGILRQARSALQPFREEADNARFGQRRTISGVGYRPAQRRQGPGNRMQRGRARKTPVYFNS